MEVHSPLDAPASGSGFLRAAGARPALVDTRRVLELRTGDPERRRLMAQARDAAMGSCSGRDRPPSRGSTTSRR
jgi:hypothetical protein